MTVLYRFVYRIHIRNSLSKLFRLTQEVFKSFINLVDVQIVHCNLQTIHPDTFANNVFLQHLALDNNQIKVINNNAFRGLDNLRYLSLANNPVALFKSKEFRFLAKIKKLVSNNYGLCCVALKSGRDLESCEPEKDEFSSCEDLIASSLLRILVWVMGVTSLVGNGLVIAWRLKQVGVCFRNIFS